MEFEIRQYEGQFYEVTTSFLASSKDRRKFLIQALQQHGNQRPDPVFRTNYGLHVDRITDGHYSIVELDGLDVFCDAAEA